jgi:hypothetical protein
MKGFNHPNVFMIMLILPLFALGGVTDLQAYRNRAGHGAQQESKTLDSLHVRMDSLTDELEARIKALEDKEAEKELEDLLEDVEKQVEKEKSADISIGRKFHSGARQLQSMNPNISASGDMFGALNTSNNSALTEPGDLTDGSDRLVMREVSLDFTSVLDPYTRGKFIIGLNGEGEIDVEEGYLEWLNLPMNLNLKVGKFNAQFGELNRWHTHALPQVDKPRPLVNLFSNENLNGVGFSADFLLPSFLAHANELSVEIISGGSGYSFTSDGVEELIYIARLKNYYDLNRNTYLELGISGATGAKNTLEQSRSNLAALDLTLKWAPMGRTKYHTVEFRNELYFSHQQRPQGNIDSYGFFSSLRSKAGPLFWIGERIDYSQLPWDKDCHEWSFSPHVDFWQSEWVMLRAQYTYTHRNYDSNDGVFYLQCSWAMGPHKHEAY